jgi:serine/threonine-protein kinase
VTCPACGRAATDGAAFCASCGARLLDSEAPTLAAPGFAATRATAIGTSSSGTFQGRFAPGMLLADRYRIAGLLGRGGMGEVYRADDLVLGQPVALKFLPDDIAASEERLARFRAEVRVAREVSHPNVCRVYDIGEAAGHPFLSMEFIDGENLASLLRRIGRLPHDTAIEMARQLCAGLAAAHEKGVLHRDLKPANVMIDGRGKVRLADFGLAAVASHAAHDALAGTPAYMAPELFDQTPPSVQSDVYALGLVLYEMFTGKAAFKSATVADMARLHRESAPTSLSQLVSDADPGVERVIARCLAKDPAERPASAMAVSAALPGGDPLAAALAAGETPSPAMVAAAGGVGALDPSAALACVASVLLGFVVVVLLSARTQAIRYAPSERSPEVLADQARSILERLGYGGRPADTAYGFTVTDYITYLRTQDRSVNRWHSLRPGQPPGFTFWYRHSPVSLTTDRFFSGGRVTLNEPPLRVPGMVSVMLDLRGRLHQLMAVPPRLDTASGDPRPPDWTALFREAGFDPARFTAAAARWTPPIYADVRAAWDGVYPDRPDVPIHVEAAAAGGRPVFFQIYEPWSATTLLPQGAGGVSAGAVIQLTTGAGVLVGALLLARRNLRLGRGDQVGAFRLALVLFLTHVASGVLAADLRVDLQVMAPLIGVLVSRGLLLAALAWVSYVAIEPDLRRRSPHMLIAWTRVLAGRLRDPLVGRDILIGIAAGTGVQLLTQLGYIAPGWLGTAPDVTLPIGGGPAGSLRALLADLLAVPVQAVLVATGFVLLIFLLHLVLRRRWLAALAVLGLLGALGVANNGFNITFGFGLATLIVMTIVAMRFGLLAFIAMNAVVILLDHTPLTFDADVWYAAYGWLTLAVLAALTVYASRTALGGRAVFEGLLVRD